MLSRAVLVRCRMLLLAARPLRGFSWLIMTQMPDIALYTSSAGPFLRELRLVSKHILLVRGRVDANFAGNGQTGEEVVLNRKSYAVPREKGSISKVVPYDGLSNQVHCAGK